VYEVEVAILAPLPGDAIDKQAGNGDGYSREVFRRPGHAESWQVGRSQVPVRDGEVLVSHLDEPIRCRAATSCLHRQTD
jgi:hypothetical protein